MKRAVILFLFLLLCLSRTQSVPCCPHAPAEAGTAAVSRFDGGNPAAPALSPGAADSQARCHTEPVALADASDEDSCPPAAQAPGGGECATSLCCQGQAPASPAAFAVSAPSLPYGTGYESDSIVFLSCSELFHPPRSLSL